MMQTKLKYLSLIIAAFTFFGCGMLGITVPIGGTDKDKDKTKSETEPASTVMDFPVIEEGRLFSLADYDVSEFAEITEDEVKGIISNASYLKRYDPFDGIDAKYKYDPRGSDNGYCVLALYNQDIQIVKDVKTVGFSIDIDISACYPFLSAIVSLKKRVFATYTCNSGEFGELSGMSYDNYETMIMESGCEDYTSFWQDEYIEEFTKIVDTTAGVNQKRTITTVGSSIEKPCNINISNGTLRETQCNQYILQKITFTPDPDQDITEPSSENLKVVFESAEKLQVVNEPSLFYSRGIAQGTVNDWTFEVIFKSDGGAPDYIARRGDREISGP